MPFKSWWVRSLPWIVVVVAGANVPSVARAGGTEFPAAGARNIGRGGAGMARADDPSVMLRNPARLADLVGDQAMLGAHLLLVDSCFQAAGAYGVGVTGDAYRLRGQLIVQNLPEGSIGEDGRPLTDIQNEPFAKVCYEGAAPFLPQLALSMKLASNLGVGLGFFPPETAQLNQFGNRDGTVDTRQGLRPNPLRYARAHLNVSYFSALAGVGYRIADWLSLGVALQWQLVVIEGRSFAPSVSGSLDPSADVRGDLFGRDLFVPGVIGSLHITPFDALDIALGAKWSDRIQSDAKLDLTAGAFGAGEAISYTDPTGATAVVGSSIATTEHNQNVQLNASPIWVPQLSAGIRFADRLAPRGAAGDSMASERWDLELDVIYYLTSFQDRTDISMNDATVVIQSIEQGGSVPVTFNAGDCIETTAAGCVRRRSRTVIDGRDQISARLGGDYNILPGLFTMRAGASYEADGQTPSWMNPMQYMAGRMGLHAGLTVRLAGATDLSIGFAHFVQKAVRLKYNPASTGEYRRYEARDPARYHLQPGGYDGTAQVEVPNSQSPAPGPFFVNAGSFYYDLDVISASLVQHF